MVIPISLLPPLNFPPFPTTFCFWPQFMPCLPYDPFQNLYFLDFFPVSPQVPSLPLLSSSVWCLIWQQSYLGSMPLSLTLALHKLYQLTWPAWGCSSTPKEDSCIVSSTYLLDPSLRQRIPKRAMISAVVL